MAELARLYHNETQGVGIQPSTLDTRTHKIDLALRDSRARITPEMVDKLDTSLSSDEILDSIESLPNGKAPGPDGLPIEL
ncbi:hypothetical protein NP233_g10327 [Leucocoprinus birnbaumii]|uniref:Uncharacterized protein n=1 Tax=Leucocoprinus birnbaumii TaxID=56174 RepID=A0AAD5YRZ8_9AGAR|nr:hypothetical protein NP233_g10327 [Leucocoprinus birnbaumii]